MKLPHILSLAFAITPAAAQTIDFESLPDGTPTVDLQEVSTQWAAAPFGVSFEVVDRNTGQFLSFPRLAKVGAPRTAFVGCGNGADLAVANAGVCQTFLTDDAMLGSIGSLRVTYITPVSGASGSLLDVDRPGGSEQWTITAFDAGGGVVDSVVIDPVAASPCGGVEGNGTEVTWSLRSPAMTAEIDVILFEYTGTHPVNNVGIAFDNFSPSSSGLGAALAGCDPTANSSGLPALTFAAGSPQAADNSLRLRTQGLPPQVFGFYVAGQVAGAPVMPANSDGFLCLTGPIGRLNQPGLIQNGGTCGLFFLDVDLTAVPTPNAFVAVAPGETWIFQAWYRDMTPGPSSNFSSAVEITFL